MSSFDLSSSNSFLIFGIIITTDHMPADTHSKDNYNLSQLACLTL